MRKLLTILFLFGIFPFVVKSQIVKPVKWNVQLSSTKLTVGDEVSLEFKATVDDGWHLYSTKIPENGPIHLITILFLDFSRSERFLREPIQ